MDRRQERGEARRYGRRSIVTARRRARSTTAVPSSRRDHRRPPMRALSSGWRVRVSRSWLLSRRKAISKRSDNAGRWSSRSAAARYSRDDARAHSAIQSR
ncbi:hypothetical protein FA95DRAFT_1194835 [Auriscalpium vulgare]|uniref:Uncharacterized protein n=1 Tax=Auriscalpium vulgare TaxID=40419 RepID=A0ACB8R4D8_9AGAM|nr:hypothetical protein FA95DRAFT_1194835 [Auriscalpium vulgare]